MIKSIKWNHHAVLGDLELDFSKFDGSIYNTIVLAGENGSGKTTVIETLAEFLNLGTFAPFERITYVADGTQYTITPIQDNVLPGFHHRRNDIDGIENDIRRNRNNDPRGIEGDNADLRYYGFAYSKARSGFSTKAVASSTTSQLDTKKREDDSTDDFTSIKQLIVDIVTQDNQDWRAESERHSGMTIEEFNQSSKMHRFESAFNSFFRCSQV